MVQILILDPGLQQHYCPRCCVRLTVEMVYLTDNFLLNSIHLSYITVCQKEGLHDVSQVFKFLVIGQLVPLREHNNTDMVVVSNQNQSV